MSDFAHPDEETYGFKGLSNWHADQSQANACYEEW